MALPEDVTTCTLTFGPYTDAAGEPVFAGMTGSITPSERQIRHAASGSVVIDEPIPVVIDAFGVATVEGIAHTAQDSLSPNAFTYTVVWNVASRKPSPGNKQIALPPEVGAEVDFDLLGESDDVEGVYVPTNYGKSAYDLAVENGFVGTEAEWIESLEGAPGVADDVTMTAVATNPASAFAVAQRAASVAVAAEVSTPAAARTGNGVAPSKVATTATTFQTGHGFALLVGGSATVAEDTTQYALGSQSVSVTTKTDNATASLQRTGMTAVDATGKDLTVTIRIDDVTNVTELIVYAASDNFTNLYQWTVQDAGLDAQKWFRSGDWATLTLSFADAAVTGAPNRAALTAFRIRARTANGFSTTLRYNRIGTVTAPTSGVVSICTDDIYASNWTQMRPILDKYGFGATCYAIPERATSDHVPIDRLHQLEDVNGWEIAAHGLTNLTSMSLAAAEADVIHSRAWLQANGFRGVDHYAYPGGGYNPAIETFMRRYYRSARTIVSRLQHETLPPANPYRLRCRSVSNTTTAAAITTEIANAKAYNSWYILTFHDIVAASATLGTQYLAADLDTICAYIASQGVAVKTVGDVLRSI